MKYKKKRKDNTVIPYYVDNDNEILYNLAIFFIEVPEPSLES
jgi:hypothetical protein